MQMRRKLYSNGPIDDRTHKHQIHTRKKPREKDSRQLIFQMCSFPFVTARIESTPPLRRRWRRRSKTQQPAGKRILTANM